MGYLNNLHKIFLSAPTYMEYSSSTSGAATGSNYHVENFFFEDEKKHIAVTGSITGGLKIYLNGIELPVNDISGKTVISLSLE